MDLCSKIQQLERHSQKHHRSTIGCISMRFRRVWRVEAWHSNQKAGLWVVTLQICHNNSVPEDVLNKRENIRTSP
jgi:hypothetical protein